MKKIKHIILLSLLLVQLSFTQGWEPIYVLPSAAYQSSSCASDGYGVHLTGVFNGVVKHFWVSNDNNILWSTLSVPGGEMPQVTLYEGTLRVTMKTTENSVQKIRIYQSQNGGYNWTQLPEYIPVGQPPIYNLFAYSDKYGTHITWDNNPDPEYPNSFQNEVYYVRYADNISDFSNFKNVTGPEMSSPTQGGRPRVAVANNKACITFLDGPDGPDAIGCLTSRDLNLDNGQWDSYYRHGRENTPFRSQSVTAIGEMLYVVGPSDIITGGCSQVQFFQYRHINDANWTSGNLGDCTFSLKTRNTLISIGSILHLVNYSPQQGIVTSHFDPAIGEWSYPYEVIEPVSNQVTGTQMLCGGQFGIYFFHESGGQYSHQHMRHKALVPNVTINSTVGSQWNMTSIPVAQDRLFKSQVYPTANWGPYKYDGGYALADPLSINRGWWIGFPSQQNISYTGARVDELNMPVKTGWNIIGSISTSVSTSSITTTPPSIVNSLYFKYVPALGYVSTSTIEPGNGIWVEVSQNGFIKLRQGGLNKITETDFDTYDKFIITDSEGNSQQLYVRNSQIVGTTESIQMPPAMPEIEFDARFSSNDIVKTVDPSEGIVDLSVNVSALSYPVSLEWQINPENEITYSFGGNGLNKVSQNGSISINQNEKQFKLSASTTNGILNAEIPNSFSLSQNFPNPFNPTTNIFYSIKTTSFVSIKVFDLLGKEITTLVNENKPTGNYVVNFNAVDLPSGVYIYKLQAGDFISSKKMILIK